MSNFNKSGGEAFPTSQQVFGGLTKLEYYAAHAISGIVATEGGEITPASAVAKRAFLIAREMVAIGNAEG